MLKDRLITLQPLDPHIHDRGMNQSFVATPETETAAAVAGGFVEVLAMPNTSPPVINKDALDQKLAEAMATVHTFYGAYVAGVHGNQKEVSEVAHRVCAMKLYMDITTGGLHIYDPEELRKHFASWTIDKPICVHAEAHTGSLQKAIGLCREFNRQLHVCHVSKADEIALVVAAKKEGLSITCEVTPHHLFLTDDDIKHLGPFALMKPELGTKKDQQALWKNIEFIDCLATDHAPHSFDTKRSDNPPYGVPGLETALPLMLQAVSEGRLTMEKLIDMVQDKPREIFRLPKRSLAGTYAHIEISQSYPITVPNLHTKCRWTPFEGHNVRGIVREVCVAGQVVFRDGEIVEPTRFGNGSVILYQSGK